MSRAGEGRAPGDAAVLVVVVTHESAHAVDRLAAGLERLREESPRRVRAVVVDQASRDGTAAALAARGLEVIAHPENRGWSAGNNLGLARREPDEGLVLLLNPDVVVSPEALERLVASLRSHDSAAAAVPFVAGAGGVRAGALPDYDLADAYLGVLGRRRLRARGLTRRLRRGEVRPLDGAYPEGGCLLLRADALDALGPLDERYFLFFDDADLGRRLAGAGYACVLAGDAVVEEAAEKGSRAAPDGDAADERVARYRRYLEAELRYYAKWWGPRTAVRIARWRLLVDLPVQERRWRRRHGIEGVAERVRDVVVAFLAAAEARA